jgi:hypothetical protein
LPGRLTGRSELDAPLANRHNDEFLSILPPDVEYRLAATLLELNTGIGLPKMLFASCCSRHGRTGTARRCKRLIWSSAWPWPCRFFAGSQRRCKRLPLHRRAHDGTVRTKADLEMTGRCDWRDCEIRGARLRMARRIMGKIVMFRLVSIISSEISAIAFAIYLWLFYSSRPAICHRRKR